MPKWEGFRTAQRFTRRSWMKQESCQVEIRKRPLNPFAGTVFCHNHRAYFWKWQNTEVSHGPSAKNP